jgi:energy-converting hydrogenase A subunit R
VHGYQFCSDSEGPLCLNDNAFELTKYFVPEGGRLFSTLSAYDDYLADIIGRPGYRAGDTLRLILPFLKAYGATNQAIENYSKKSVNWVPRAKDALGYITGKLNTFIITTSYEQFAYPMYQGVGISRENIYCTRLDLDAYLVDSAEIKQLKQIAREIASMPVLDLNGPLSDITRNSLARLDELFWQIIPALHSGKLIQDIQVMGGEMKARAIQHSLQRTGLKLNQVMFVGDSITDVEAFRLVREAGGVSVSFNGNAYALREAEIGCISSNALVSAALALVFANGGKKQVYKLVANWDKTVLRGAGIPDELTDQLFSDSDNQPHLEIITQGNRDELIRKSQQMRKALRGKAVGALG